MNTKRIRKVALWSALVVIVASVVVGFLPVPPHGRFNTPDVGNLAHAYFEFADGKASTVVFGGERGREGEEFRHLFGDYHKEHGRWVLVTPDGSTGELRATFLSLKIIDPGTPPTGPFYRYEIYKGR